MPTPVKPDKQLFLGRLCVPGRPVPPLLASLMPPRLIRSAMEAAGEQPPQQQQQLTLLDSTGGAGGSNGGGGAAVTAAGAAAVADGGLDGLLQAGDSSLDRPFDAAAAAAAVGRPPDQQQKQPKRLGGLRPLEDAQTSKKPRTVAASTFSAPTNGSLAGVSGRFYRLVPAIGLQRRGLSTPRVIFVLLSPAYVCLQQTSLPVCSSLEPQ
jgi:hypothetical protein